jgi:glycosyltransferase involved in cell wall biosynthesis/SAM-dependent methyltransferase
MNILFSLHQFFPHHYTGTERLVLNLSKQLQKNGHRVKVLTYGIIETDDYRCQDGFLIKEYIFEGVPVISVRHVNIPEDISFTIFDPSMEKILHSILQKNSFDIIHVCHPMRTATVIKVAKKHNIPVLLTITDFWLMCPRVIASTPQGNLCNGSADGKECIAECYGPLWSEKIQRRFTEATQVFTMVSRVVFPTEFLQSMFLKKMFSGQSGLIRFGNDYCYIRDNTKHYTEKSEVTLGFLSSLLPHKGAHILVKAFIQADQNNLALKIYGDPLHEMEYFEQLKNQSKEHRIEFLGRYNNKDMENILQDLDVVVLPSMWWENTPLVMLQALAHKVPVIVSDFPGMTEIINNGVNGFVFRPGDDEHLKEILIQLGKNPILINDIKNNISYSKRIEEEAFEYEVLYKEILSNFSPDIIQHSNCDLIRTAEPDMSNLKIDPVLHTFFVEKYGQNFFFEINDNDAMYQYLKDHPAIKDPVKEYYLSGESMIQVLDDILLDQKIIIKNVSSFLDFASGYGRFTRFLPYMFRLGAITVSDIDKEAVDFCKDRIGVNGFYSSEKPAHLDIQTRFDIIWVASLFSHLSLHSWKEWIEKLYGLLNDNGLLIFSTHGCHCYNLLDEITKKNLLHLEHGFYFMKQSEINTLSTDIYGTAYVTEEFVKKHVEKNKLGQIVGYYPQKLWNFQDIYVIKKT